MMEQKTILRAGLPFIACAAAFCATEVWNTKDPAVWTTEDANIILNNSPWAKQIKISPAGSGQARRGGYPGGGRRGGGGANRTPVNGVVGWGSGQPVQTARKRL